MVGVGALVVAQAVVVMLLPWPMAIAVDDVLGDQPLPGWAQSLADTLGATTLVGQLLLAGAALVLLAVVNGVLSVVSSSWRRSLGLRMSHDLGEDALAQVQRQSPAAEEHLAPGDLVQRVVVNARAVDTLVFAVGATAFAALVTLLLLGAVVSTFSGSAVAIGAAVVAGMALVTRRFHRRMDQNARRLADTEADVMVATEQMLVTLPEIQSFAAEAAELHRFTTDADALVTASVRVERTNLGFRAGIGTMTALGTAAVLAYGGLSVLDGTWTLGELLVVVAHLAQSVAHAKAGAQRLQQLEAVVEAVTEPEEPHFPPPPRQALGVQFESVTFGWSPGEPVLEAVDLHIRPGETVGIVGPSGTGKSTLLGLLPRFYDPWRGTVRVGGIDVRDLRTEDLRHRVALVHQDPLLLPVSVHDNIAYGTRWATRAEVERAARHALAHEFVMSLPQGYDTVLAERGRSLSGGQRQRLAIARALCRGAGVLLLDEPTAGLDADAESALLSLVAEAATDCTVVVITHRISSLNAVDRVVVLDGTRIVEDGSPAELLERDGVFRRYARLQALTGRVEPPEPLEPHIVLDG
jgi:ATP-binding cassette subfamily B protein/subfamily B ATP-binding cassette protein MsbA